RTDEVGQRVERQPLGQGVGIDWSRRAGPLLLPRDGFGFPCGALGGRRTASEQSAGDAVGKEVPLIHGVALVEEISLAEERGVAVDARLGADAARRDPSARDL